jgi:hypothetical protein
MVVTGSTDTPAYNERAAPISAVAAAPIHAVLRTRDTAATRALPGNPFVILFPLNLVSPELRKTGQSTREAHAHPWR